MTATEGLLTAMLAVQGEAPTLQKTASNPAYKGSKYAPLDSIVETIGPILAKHGLVWTALPSHSEGTPTLKYKLSHAASGESETGEMLLLLSKADAQGQGSAITYARRYALCAVLNLVADDDDDGARAAQAPSRQAERGKDASPAQKKLVRALMTKNGVTLGEAKRLLAAAGVELADGENPRDAVDRLEQPGVSSLIDVLKEGPVKTGESDVPAPEGFVHPPVQDDLFEPAAQ